MVELFAGDWKEAKELEVSNDKEIRRDPGTLI